MSTKNNPGTFDCYANAKPDEEMFVLLGRDPLAGSLVRAWANAREDMLGSRPDPKDVQQIAEARQCADRLDHYCSVLGKVPLSIYYGDDE